MQKRTFTDQLGRRITVDFPPKRIISLVPSQTELLFDLGLEKEVAGITKFCVHPVGHFKVKDKIGGTKQLNLEKIRRLKPDLIIGNKEENNKEDIEALMKEFPVWMSDIYNLNDALDMIDQVGSLTGKRQSAQKIAGDIRAGFLEMELVAAERSLNRPRVAYLIWKYPYMVAAQNTFINEMLRTAGFTNAFSWQRYPEVSAADIQRSNPDMILLSSEPYPFKEKHVAEFKNMCPDATIRIVDGEMFSWYGSRLRLVPAYLQSVFEKA